MGKRLQHIRDVPSGFLRRPIVIATLVGLTYTIIGILYISYSDAIAMKMVTTVEQLDRIQSIKGIGFIIFMGLGLFATLYFLLKSLNDAAIELSRRNRAILLSEQRAMAGIFASSIAHDMNNYLMVITGELENLESVTNSPAARDHIKRLYDGLDRLTQIASRLQHTGQGNADATREIGDMIEFVRESVEFARGHNRIKSCGIRIDVRQNFEMQTNGAMVNQAVVNLILNAAEVMGGNGEILVIVDLEDGVPVLEVHDSGPGIPEHQRQKILEPFYTTKNGGTGLGLMSVKALTDLHSGKLQIRSSELGGACFHLQLPGFLGGSGTLQMVSLGRRSVDFSA